MDDGTRTRDNRNHNPGLYQLSYSHHLKQICNAVMQILVRPARLELTTPGLEGRCSIRLSYGRLSVQRPGRGERIRTSDILVPNQARYRAALHPEDAAFYSGTPHRSIESMRSDLPLATPGYF